MLDDGETDALQSPTDPRKPLSQIRAWEGVSASEESCDKGDHVALFVEQAGATESCDDTTTQR